MDEHDGQGHFKGKSKQVLQISSGRGAGHKDDAGLDHFWNFPFIMDEGDAQVKFPDLDAGLLLTVFPPGGRKHEIHKLTVPPNKSLFSCAAMVLPARSLSRLCRLLLALYLDAVLIIARSSQNAMDIPSSFYTNMHYLHKKPFCFSVVFARFPVLFEKSFQLLCRNC